MPTLFWSAGAGEEGQQIDVFNAAMGPARFIAVQIAPTDVLPPGDYDGQPLVWSGEGQAWLGGPGIVVTAVTAPPTDNLAITGGENGVDISAVGTGTVQMIGPGNSVTLSAGQTSIAASSLQRLFLAVDGSPIFDANSAGAGGISFLGKSPTVGVQSVAGATSQEQIDSLVAALAAFGLCSDDRDPNPGVYVSRLEGVDLSGRVIEVIPAAAPSGVYIIGFSVNCRTPQTAGTYASNVTFLTPQGQASSFGWGNVQVTSAGIFSAGTTSTMPRTLAFGSGTACNLTLTPTGITGSPVYDFYVVAQFVAPIP